MGKDTRAFLSTNTEEIWVLVVAKSVEVVMDSGASFSRVERSTERVQARFSFEEDEIPLLARSFAGLRAWVFAQELKWGRKQQIQQETIVKTNTLIIKNDTMVDKMQRREIILLRKMRLQPVHHVANALRYLLGCGAKKHVMLSVEDLNLGSHGT